MVVYFRAIKAAQTKTRQPANVRMKERRIASCIGQGDFGLNGFIKLR